MNLAPLRWAALPAVLLIACSHADAFDNPGSTVGAFNAGPDVRLTVNANQDYWPSWTEDGHGILYSYIESTTLPQHRCLGLLPAAGGTRTWQLCDDRAIQADSTNSFIAYALGSDGRLIYAEAVAKGGVQSTAPTEITLWLADSATPFQRRALLTLPTFAQGTSISWLADINWTGPASFIALAQDFTVLGHCLNCGAIDSIFYGRGVVRGTVTATGATLQIVPGTTGATSYSLAENGASIAFTLRDDAHLYKVPAIGGTAVSVGVISPIGGAELLGVSCKAATCIVAVDPVTLSAATDNGIVFGHTNVGATELRAISLTSGQVQVARTTTALVATPQISPATGDVVAQLGGAFGHLQSLTTSGSDLHLFQGLVP